jgi:hypothetical protein
MYQTKKMPSNNVTTDNNNNEFAQIYFKVAHTGQNAMFNVPTNICIANLIEFAKYEAYDVFQISRNQELEIVEVGQDFQGRSEDAPALERDFDTTVRQKYNGAYNNVAFYIRFVQ